MDGPSEAPQAVSLLVGRELSRVGGSVDVVLQMSVDRAASEFVTLRDFSNRFPASYDRSVDVVTILMSAHGTWPSHPVIEPLVFVS